MSRDDDRLHHQKVVLEGWWRYDEKVDKPVWIVEQNYDAFYEMEVADAREWKKPPGFEPSLTGDGICYAVSFLKSFDGKGFQVRDQALSVEDAKAIAQELTPTPIEWRSPSAG